MLVYKSPPNDLVNTLNRSHGPRIKLANMDLSGVDLAYANFSGAHLKNINLSGGRITCANFTGAVLIDCNLTNAEACHALFDRASIHDTSFAGVDLTDASFHEAHLRGIDFYGASLTGGNFIGAEFDRILAFPPSELSGLSILPEEGPVIGWKKAQAPYYNNTCLVKLRIPAKAGRVNYGRSCRGARAFVLDIVGAPYGVSFCSDPLVIYRPGATVKAKDFSCDPLAEGPGIHFFLTRKEAEDFYLNV
jgi:hypothetical protein